MRFAIIDESGRLYDPEDRIVIFAAVVSESLINLDKIIEHLYSQQNTIVAAFIFMQSLYGSL